MRRIICLMVAAAAVIFLTVGCFDRTPLITGPQKVAAPDTTCHPESTATPYTSNSAYLSAGSPTGTLIEHVVFDCENNAFWQQLPLSFDVSSGENMTCDLERLGDPDDRHYLRQSGASDSLIRQPSGFEGDTTLVVVITNVPLGEYQLVIHYNGPAIAQARARPAGINSPQWHPIVRSGHGQKICRFCR